jgi:hypothetical protein
MWMRVYSGDSSFVSKYMFPISMHMYFDSFLEMVLFTCSLTAFAISIAFNVSVSLLFSFIALMNSDLDYFHVCSVQTSFFHALILALRSICSLNWFNPWRIRVELSMISFKDSREFFAPVLTCSILVALHSDHTVVQGSCVRL